MRIRIDTARIPAPRRTNASSGPGSERPSNSVRRKAAATNAPAMRPKRAVRLILRTSRARLAAERTAMTSETCYKAKKRDGAHLGGVREGDRLAGAVRYAFRDLGAGGDGPWETFFPAPFFPVGAGGGGGFLFHPGRGRAPGAPRPAQPR